MKTKQFKFMMAGIEEAIKYRRGKKANVRVSRFLRTSKQLKPLDIRKIRTTLGVSQVTFAQYLGTSVGTVRSWEQGVRRPQSTALHLLTIAKQKPALLLQRVD
jgi:putative transcriptional regulator